MFLGRGTSIAIMMRLIYNIKLEKLIATVLIRMYSKVTEGV
jgi:hypothetical protein